MTCAEFEHGLDPFLDNEVSWEIAQEMQAHIEQCEVCKGLFADRVTIRRCLQNPELRYRPAADLQDRIHRVLLSEIRAKNPSSSPAIDWLSWLRLPDWLLPAAAGAAAVLIFWAGFAVLPSRISPTGESGSGLAEQLVSNHIRSLVGSHLMDVVSTDQHTVKPWFAGKLSFSPPVFDFSDQGFKLIGGRLDYLGNKEIAAVVYQHRQHYINLFAWPSQAGQPQEIATQREGYNLYGWTAQGLTLWAVTDAEPETLKSFVELLKQQEARGER
ncbi:MAG: anti-sigma factor [Verrucomicrobia bacterium]|nr:anti-sigma factor [Verrucomicrobiota bacterium]